MSSVLTALADAARDNRREEFDRLERELLSNFEGGFDGMPEPIYESYLAIDRLWPVAPRNELGTDASQRRVVRVSLTSAEQAWLRQLGVDADRSASAVLSACLRLIREDPHLASRVALLLRSGPDES